MMCFRSHALSLNTPLYLATQEDAVDLTGFDEVTDTSQEVFSCGDGRFLTAIDLDEYDLNSNRGEIQSPNSSQGCCCV